MPGISQLPARWRWPVGAAHRGGSVWLAFLSPLRPAWCQAAGDAAPGGGISAGVSLGWEAARADGGRGVHAFLFWEKAKVGKQMPSPSGF